MAQEDWEKLCNKLAQQDEAQNAEYQVEVDADGAFGGLVVWCHHTDHGDGTFLAIKNTLPMPCVCMTEFTADSGMLGILPAELTENSSHAMPQCGMTLKFDADVTCTYDDGLFRIASGTGELVIDTRKDLLELLIDSYIASTGEE
jgi:hypothetical protein